MEIDHVVPLKTDSNIVKSILYLTGSQCRDAMIGEILSDPKVFCMVR